jgi:hypothetical protein
MEVLLEGVRSAYDLVVIDTPPLTAVSARLTESLRTERTSCTLSWFIASEESEPSMPEPISISLFRQKTGPYFTKAVHKHSPLAIRRGSEDLGLLLGRDEAWALLADHSFTPEVMRGDGGVSIWLPEFAVYGQGATYAEAKADLLDEVRVYIDEYLVNAAEYQRARNRAAHLPHVVKAYLADLRGELELLIFPGPPDLPVARTHEVSAPARR